MMLNVCAKIEVKGQAPLQWDCTETDKQTGLFLLLTQEVEMLCYSEILGNLTKICLLKHGYPSSKIKYFCRQQYYINKVILICIQLGDRVSTQQIRQLYEAGNITLNLVDPPRKDTVKVQGGGYTIIRWKADNPGR